MPSEPFPIKLVVVGDGCVGKTSILHRFHPSNVVIQPESLREAMFPQFSTAVQYLSNVGKIM